MHGTGPYQNVRGSIGVTVVQQTQPDDVDIALLELKMSADYGSLEAQKKIASLYYDTELFDSAFRYFRLAAEQGDSGAQNSVGLMYAGGQGVRQNSVLADIFFKLSADQNNPDGLYHLARLRLDIATKSSIKRPITQTLAEVMNYLYVGYWYGSIEAENLLKELVPDATDESLQRADEIAPFENLYVIKELARRGDAKQQLALARHYFANRGNNPMTGLHYCMLIASQGNVEAQTMLIAELKKCDYATLNQLSEDQLSETKKAYVMTELEGRKAQFDQCMESARSGDSSCQLALATMYFEGMCTSRDVEKALDYCTLSADMGNKEALNILTRELKKLNPAQLAQLARSGNAYVSAELESRSIVIS